MTNVYLEPIVTDRVLADVTNETVKGFYNVADWQRLYHNAQVAKVLVDWVLSLNITFNVVEDVAITTIPSVNDLNILLANINRIYQSSTLQQTLGLALLNEAWADGTATASPDYLDANEWESLLDAVYTSIAPVLDYRVYCGVPAVGQPRFYQHRWRTFEWVADAVAPVRRERTGMAICSAGLTRNNGFRRYD